MLVFTWAVLQDNIFKGLKPYWQQLRRALNSIIATILS